MQGISHTLEREDCQESSKRAGTKAQLRIKAPDQKQIQARSVTLQDSPQVLRNADPRALPANLYTEDLFWQNLTKSKQTHTYTHTKSLNSNNEKKD